LYGVDAGSFEEKVHPRDVQEALDISRQIGSPDAEVTALNESGTLSRIRGDLGQACSSHQQALDLARHLGIALQEAHALAGLGRCARAASRTAEAEDRLRQALAILQRIGAAEAADVPAELDAPPGAPDPAQPPVMQARLARIVASAVEPGRILL
jgi:hypothetical protein